MTNMTLAQFIQRPEPKYQWHCTDKRHSEEFPNIEILQLELTSQCWLEGERRGIDQPLWVHRLTLYLPTRQKAFKPCLLMVHGGYRHNPEMETAPSAQVDAAKVCYDTQAPVACLRDVPNQPQIIDGIPRTEDDLVAWSWQQFLQTEKKEGGYLLQWPMVKSIIRAMDALEECCNQRIPSFIVAGASKRGWISWLAASCDQRISAIIPIVIDVLNIKQCMEHHLQVYNGWAEAIADYTDPDHDILADLESEEMDTLLLQVDPFNHRQQLSLPKFIVNASCDEFFPPDSAQFYYHQLPGFSALRYLPNASHYLGLDASVCITEVITSCFGSMADQKTMPEMNWQSTDKGIAIDVDQAPLSACVWLCHNPEQRDFRKITPAQPKYAYQARPLEAQSVNPWRFHYNPKLPSKGWIAFFIELRFDNGTYPDLVYTSGVKVLPDCYPDQ